jgi:hypothetical protein
MINPAKHKRAWGYTHKPNGKATDEAKAWAFTGNVSEDLTPAQRERVKRKFDSMRDLKSPEEHRVALPERNGAGGPLKQWKFANDGDVMLTQTDPRRYVPYRPAHDDTQVTWESRRNRKLWDELYARRAANQQPQQNGETE